MPEEITNEQVQKFLKAVMEIERRFSNELSNSNTNRRNDIREHLDRFVARELRDEDS
jgi:hypothetical protein